MNLSNKRVLVTGGAGFIGGHLVKKLINLGAKVITLDIIVKPNSIYARNKLANKSTLKITDVRNKKKVSEIINKYKPAYIFHLAAQTLVPDAFTFPLETFETNIMGTVNLLEAARKLKSIEGIIVASSDKAYGKLHKKKYIESDALKGDHPYEASKSSTDIVTYSYFKTYGLPAVVTRFGNVYGEGDLNFSRIVPGIMQSLVENKTLKLRSDGEHVRDYIYVEDVIDGYLLLAKNIQKIRGEAFNFGSAETLSVLQLINLYEKALRRKIPYKILNKKENEIPYQSLDYSKIRKALNWKPHSNLKTTANRILKYYSSIL